MGIKSDAEKINSGEYDMEIKEEEKVDNVNHPNHYANSCSVECIDTMLVAFGSYVMYYHCIATAYEYIWRWKNKNGKEDLSKAQWYLDKASWIYNNADEDDREDFDLDVLNNMVVMLEKAKKQAEKS